MGNQIEPIDRVRESQDAFRMYTEGVSKREIARRLERDRSTVDVYLEEAAEWVRSENVETKRAAIVASHRRIIEKAWEMVNSGEIKPTSLAGPQYLLQIREALKEIARIEGMYIDRREVTHSGDFATIADMLREANDSGDLDEIETLEEIEPGVYGRPDEPKSDSDI